MTPKEISRASDRIFCGVIPRNWAIRSQQDQEDFGIDYELEVMADHDQPTGFIFKVQQKGELESSFTADEKHLTLGGLPVAKLRYYLEQVHIPVVLVLVDTTAGAVYWTIIQGNAAVESAYRDAVAAGHKTTTVHVPKDNLLPATTSQMLDEVNRTLDFLIVRRACTMPPTRVSEASQRVEALRL